jgi:uncharacterized 2Fe-2S/4Fe-4S cluster protein (DUF4445 family)
MGAPYYGIAFDIGTTTIAAYMYELPDGARIGALSAMNPQAKYGADVITRIAHTINAPGGAADMRRAAVGALNGLTDRFLRQSGVDRDDVLAVCAAGNAAMMHFLLELPAAGIAAAPFIPVANDLLVTPAKSAGLNISGVGRLICLPGVSAYIGADTVAAVLACRLHKSGAISLLIDLGTNGEIVLGCREWMLACSTAAGPAFEGANIRNGVGGVAGAIDSVRIGDEGIELTTIGGKAAIGLCGSGLVDAAAALLRCGIIDETGKLLGADEIEIPKSYGRGLRARLRAQISERLIEIGGMRAFLIAGTGDAAGSDCVAADADSAAGSDRIAADAGSAAAGTYIALTQKDIRELQNAKAAIAAGINVLIAEAGITARDIGRVFLAGGFGSFIDKKSAVELGLIPRLLSGRIESVGNAAGAGAVEALLSKRALGEAQRLKRRIRYIELSALPKFMYEYIQCMGFEQN